ncbi:MAG: 3-hydroxyacyl-CoA dehydrogenase [Candidatus Obscuribacterales bacterium]|nr:3-hydroxyacyl-CoA dehydrogenase [Candidatus Obscuribacterales bacterium]
MTLNTVAVVGAGTMGSSIALAVAMSELPVVLKDVDSKAVDNGIKRIEKMIASQVRKGLSESDAAKRRALITGTTEIKDIADASFVIEVVPEQLHIKEAVLSELDAVLKPGVIIATNTSSLPISQLARFTKRPDKVVGLHFFNPAHLMKLVEVIPGLDTNESTVEAAMDFARKLGKMPVRVEECASFLVNRLLGRYMNESLFCLEEGLGNVEQIDQAVCDYVMPVGPFTLRDMNGCDIGLAVARFNFQEYGPRFAVPGILESMVTNNWLGQKTGRGFYTYDSETKKKAGINPELSSVVKGASSANGSLNAERLFLPMINEAFLALQEKICRAEDLDPALKAGLGMRKGPLELAGDMGLDNCLKQMQSLFEKYGERFRPAPLLKRYVFAGHKKLI